jgi:retron-type reverse transcriptase
VNDAAIRSRRTRFTALFHHLTLAALERAFRRLRRTAAPGVDGMTVADYERDLEVNLRALHCRLEANQYRPRPARRTYIPKADGGRRALGILAIEDKIVQGAVAEVLNAIYEADFHDTSFGFRPGRGAHDALRTVHAAIMTERVGWVVDADIRNFKSGMASPLPEPPDRRPAHHPPDQEMAQGGSPGRRGRERQ